jgi:putative adenylate-forming enzyme
MLEFNRINTLGLDLNQCMDIALNAERTRDFSPMIQGISVGLSTGTSGNRGIFLASLKERAAWVACMLDRVIGFSFRKRKLAFFLRANNNLYKSTPSGLIAFKYFDIFKPMTGHLDALNTFQPDILIAQPSILCMLADAQQEGRIGISPCKIISVAEVLSPEDRSYLEKAFGQRIHQVYQCTEGFLAASCKEGTLHFNEDFLNIERNYIDDAKERFHPVITDLLRHTQPIIRYELNDIIREKKHCPCGSQLTAIESIEGRSDDILLFRTRQGSSVPVFPDLIRRCIVLADEQVTDYCLIQRSEDRLQLYIDSTSGNSLQTVCGAILDLLTNLDIHNVVVEEIGDSPFLIGNKKRRVRNETPQTR